MSGVNITRQEFLRDRQGRTFADVLNDLEIGTEDLPPAEIRSVLNQLRDGLRALPLPDFPRVEVGMLWQHNPNPATQALIGQLRREAKRLDTSR